MEPCFGVRIDQLQDGTLFWSKKDYLQDGTLLWSKECINYKKETFSRAKKGLIARWKLVLEQRID